MKKKSIITAVAAVLCFAVLSGCGTLDYSSNADNSASTGLSEILEQFTSEAKAETEAPIEETEAPIEETEAPIEETETPIEDTEAVEDTEADSDPVTSIVDAIAETIAETGDEEVQAESVVDKLSDAISAGAAAQTLSNAKVIKETPLDEISPLNGGFDWNNGTPEDPFGNDYSKIQNYAILHASSARDNIFQPGGDWRSLEYYTEYFLDGEYDELSFTISPYSDCNADAVSYVQVYVNDVLKYTSTTVNQKSGKILVQGVDISDADYLKLYVYVSEYGCLMLSDVKVLKTAGYVGSNDPNVVPLSSIQALNGGFSFSNGYPQNIAGDDYTFASNYCICHGQYCYHSYTAYSEIYTDGQYKTFSMDFAPYTDFGENAQSTIIIYADDDEIYRSTINQRSPKTSTGNLNISGVTYLKIVIEKGDYGCVIISDAKLKK